MLYSVLVNLQVYKSQYAANPFETMSEDELERYKWEVEHKGQDGLATVEGLPLCFSWLGCLSAVTLV